MKLLFMFFLSLSSYQLFAQRGALCLGQNGQCSNLNLARVPVEIDVERQILKIYAEDYFEDEYANMVEISCEISFQSAKNLLRVFVKLSQLDSSDTNVVIKCLKGSKKYFYDQHTSRQYLVNVKTSLNDAKIML